MIDPYDYYFCVLGGEIEEETQRSRAWTWLFGGVFLLAVCYVVFGPLSGVFFPVTDSTVAHHQVHHTHTAISLNASARLVRLSQLDPAQYSSTQEFQLWAYSACSTTSMTEVFDSYGRHYRIADVLKVESQIDEITPQLGLLEDIGIQRTAAHFGFKTTWGHNLSLDQIISIANRGKPVIVSFPPDRYAGGHLLVVTGGNSSIVKLADSSLWNRQSLSRSQFLQWWEGFYAIVTPA